MLSYREQLRQLVDSGDLSTYMKQRERGDGFPYYRNQRPSVYTLPPEPDTGIMRQSDSVARSRPHFEGNPGRFDRRNEDYYRQRRSRARPYDR